MGPFFVWARYTDSNREVARLRECMSISQRACEGAKLPKLRICEANTRIPLPAPLNDRVSSNGGFFYPSTPRGTPSTVGLLTIQRNVAGIRACQACSRYHCPIRAISIFSFLHPTSHEENHEFIAGDRARIRAARLRPSWQRPQPQHPPHPISRKKSRSLSKSTDCSA